MQVGPVVLTFLITVLLLLTLRPLASAVGLVDLPGGRKTHGAPVPLIGGICMSIGLGFGAALIDHPPSWNAVLLGIYGLVVVGTIDDRFDLPPYVRLVAQSGMALFVIYGAGIQVASLGSPLFFAAPLGWLSVPFTLLFIMTLINAFNFTDGLDGLTGGLALISLISMAILGAGSDVFPLILLLIAALVGFLAFNFPLRSIQPVRTFMGDAGSTFVGLCIACIGIVLSQGAAETTRTPVMGLWLVAIPVFELFCSILRRTREGKSPLEPDHGHLHHVLVAAGLSRRATLVAILALACVCAAVGIVGSALRISDGVMLIVWFAAGTVYYRLLRRSAAVTELVQSLRVLHARLKVGAAQPQP